MEMKGKKKSRGLNSDKAKRATRRPLHPGKNCQAEPEDYCPTVNQNKCEGKGDCIEVCPFNVFEVRRMNDLDFARDFSSYLV